MADTNNLVEIANILSEVKQYITTDSDMLWTYYEYPDQLLADLDGYIFKLTAGDTSCIEEVIYHHFAAAGTFQEHSIMNGWTEEYMALATRFDALVESYSRK